jgi:rare lipoprotein A (peptidoglycan hydrolase)
VEVTVAFIEQLLALLAVLGGGQLELGTVFGSSKWDPGNPNSRLACYHREIDDARDLVVAHNTLPCKTKVLIFNPRTGRTSIAHVGDRGPRHAGIDLSRRVARQLRHNGFETVLVVPLPGAERKRPSKPRVAETTGPPAEPQAHSAFAETDIPGPDEAGSLEQVEQRTQEN